MRTLEQVRSALIERLGEEGKLPMVNARVILRTGVSLTNIDPRHATDSNRIGKVLMVLREMGYDLKTVK